MEYLGDLGRLVPLRCASTESIGSEPRYVVRSTVEGARRAQIVPGMPRTWSVDWDLAHPGEGAALQGFTAGAWGPGPWHWVSVQAQHENLLTPREAMLLDYETSGYLALGGSVHVHGIRSPLSLLHNRASYFTPVFRNIPVLPGRALTWAAEINSSGGVAPRLYLRLLDANGATISNHYGTGAVSSAVQRVSVTVTPPSNAVSIIAGLDYTTTRMIRPQVTWTDGPVEYGPGHGCRSAIIDAPSSSVLLSTRELSYSNHGFTVMEVS